MEGGDPAPLVVERGGLALAVRDVAIPLIFRQSSARQKGDATEDLSVHAFLPIDAEDDAGVGGVQRLGEGKDDTERPVEHGAKDLLGFVRGAGHVIVERRALSFQDSLEFAVSVY